MWLSRIVIHMDISHITHFFLEADVENLDLLSYAENTVFQTQTHSIIYSERDLLKHKGLFSSTHKTCQRLLVPHRQRDYRHPPRPSRAAARAQGKAKHAHQRRQHDRVKHEVGTENHGGVYFVEESLGVRAGEGVKGGRPVEERVVQVVVSGRGVAWKAEVVTASCEDFLVDVGQPQRGLGPAIFGCLLLQGGYGGT